MLGRCSWKGSRSLAVVLALAIAVAVWAVTYREISRESSMTSQGSVAVAADITMEDLAKVSHTKVFFGHQSVGMNILDGVGGVYAAHGMTAPVIEEGATDPGRDGGFIDHAFIGENANPMLKIQDFAAKLRSGLGPHVDMAMMKFCYVDINSSAGVGTLFATYRTTMTALQREFPNVTLIYVTVPLTTDAGFLSRLKSRLTGSGGMADNAARERLNALIRHEYAGNHLFDLAAIESTAPDGSRVTGTYRGQRYYALYNGYAADFGHLNAEGAGVVATTWLKAIARASQR
jgi:hypothetical protein